jgi:hypothetical protein
MRFPLKLLKEPCFYWEKLFDILGNSRIKEIRELKKVEKYLIRDF